MKVLKTFVRPEDGLVVTETSLPFYCFIIQLHVVPDGVKYVCLTDTNVNVLHLRILTNISKIFKALEDEIHGLKHCNIIVNLKKNRVYCIFYSNVAKSVQFLSK